MAQRRGIAFFRPEVRPGTLTGAQARGAAAVGALAVGAVAVGGFAIGRLAIGRLAIGRAAIDKLAIRSLSVEELEIGRIRVREGWPPPATNQPGDAGRAGIEFVPRLSPLPGTGLTGPWGPAPEPGLGV